MTASTGDFGELLRDGRKWLWWTVVIGNCFISLYGLWLLIEATLGFAVPNDPQLIRAIEFVLYLVLWTSGLACDVTAQRRVYAIEKYYNQIPRQDFLVAASIVLAGILLFLAIKSDKWFAAALSFLFASNLLSWKYFTVKVQAIFQSSKSAYADSKQKLARLNMVERYLLGKWQARRFLVMFLVLLIADIVCFSAEVREFLASHLQFLFSNFSKGAISEFLPELAFGLFIFVAEIWNWSRRLPVYLAAREETNNSLSIPGKVQNKNHKGGNPKALRAHMDQSFRRIFKLPPLLWAAHGAAFSLIKGIEIVSGHNPLPINSLKYFAAISLPGFAYAVFGYISLMIVHENVMDSFFSKTPTTTERTYAYRKAFGDLAVSLALLLIPPLILFAASR